MILWLWAIELRLERSKRWPPNRWPTAMHIEMQPRRLPKPMAKRPPLNGHVNTVPSSIQRLQTYAKCAIRAKTLCRMDRRHPLAFKCCFGICEHGASQRHFVVNEIELFDSLFVTFLASIDWVASNGFIIIIKHMKHIICNLLLISFDYYLLAYKIFIALLLLRRSCVIAQSFDVVIWFIFVFYFFNFVWHWTLKLTCFWGNGIYSMTIESLLSCVVLLFKRVSDTVIH